MDRVEYKGSVRLDSIFRQGYLSWRRQVPLSEHWLERVTSLVEPLFIATCQHVCSHLNSRNNEHSRVFKYGNLFTSGRRKQVVARTIYIGVKWSAHSGARVYTLCAVIFAALSSFLAFNNNNNKNNSKNCRSIRGASPPNVVKPDVRARQWWWMDGAHYTFSYASVTSSAVRVSLHSYSTRIAYSTHYSQDSETSFRARFVIWCHLIIFNQQLDSLTFDYVYLLVYVFLLYCFSIRGPKHFTRKNDKAFLKLSTFTHWNAY